jgi:hypothetical protein
LSLIVRVARKIPLEVLRSTTITVLVPTALLWASSCMTYRSHVHWALWSVGLAAYVAFIYLTGDWFLIGYGFRFLLLAGYAVVVVISFLSLQERPPYLPIGSREAVGIMFFALFGALTIIALRGRRCAQRGVEALFPMRHGVYCVAAGGGNVLLNHHYPARYARFAIDIVELNVFGFRARGFYPKQLRKYLIFGKTVYSPVDGVVVKVADGIPDMVPPTEDRDHPAGNYVMIKHAPSGSLILLAHLQQDSVVVREGESVSAGQAVAKVGNSGISTEPHLHMSCEIDEVEEYNLEGQSVPLYFDGRFLTRNAVLRVSQTGR